MTQSELAQSPIERGDSAPAEAVSRARARRLLLVASDRRFRAVASALLTQHGYAVTIGNSRANVAELAVRDRADVVVLDASASLTDAAHEAARLGALQPPVALVAVSSEPQDELAAMPVISKWTSFDELLLAIEQALPGSDAELARAVTEAPRRESTPVAQTA
jgi:DNA-binding response OmpR family regulator